MSDIEPTRLNYKIGGLYYDKASAKRCVLRAVDPADGAFAYAEIFEDGDITGEYIGVELSSTSLVAVAEKLPWLGAK